MDVSPSQADMPSVVSTIVFKNIQRNVPHWLQTKWMIGFVNSRINAFLIASGNDTLKLSKLWSENVRILARKLISEETE
jgi:hypothetical protein